MVKKKGQHYLVFLSASIYRQIILIHVGVRNTKITSNLKMIKFIHYNLCIIERSILLTRVISWFFDMRCVFKSRICCLDGWLARFRQSIGTIPAAQEESKGGWRSWRRENIRAELEYGRRNKTRKLMTSASLSPLFCLSSPFLPSPFLPSFSSFPAASNESPHPVFLFSPLYGFF